MRHDHSNLRKAFRASGFVWQVPHHPVDATPVLTQITLAPPHSHILSRSATNVQSVHRNAATWFSTPSNRIALASSLLVRSPMNRHLALLAQRLHVGDISNIDAFGRVALVASEDFSSLHHVANQGAHDGALLLQAQMNL